MKDATLKMLLALIAVFAPIQAMLATTVCLVVADLVTGVLASKKKGQPITSEGLRRSITKMLVYNAALMLGHVTEVYMLHGTLPVAKIVSGFIGVTELLSVLENLNVLSGQDLLRAAIDKLKIKKDEK